jgi:hypothetical protein
MAAAGIARAVVGLRRLALVEIVYRTTRMLEVEGITMTYEDGE